MKIQSKVALRTADAPVLQYDSVDGIDFSYVEYGAPDNRPTAVFLHGLSMPPTHWGELPNMLGRHIIALGAPVGKSAPEQHTLAGYAKKMVPPIHALTSGNYDLLGLSWGGLAAQQIAIDDRRSVRRLVLAGTPLATPASFLGGMPNPEAMQAIQSPDRSAATNKKIFGGDFCNDALVAAEVQGLVGRSIDKLEHERQIRAAKTFGHLVARRMWQFNAPKTLVLAGDDDPIVPYAGVCFGAMALGAELETVPHGGHGFLLTRPAEMADCINDFLDRP